MNLGKTCGPKEKRFSFYSLQHFPEVHNICTWSLSKRKKEQKKTRKRLKVRRETLQIISVAFRRVKNVLPKAIGDNTKTKIGPGMKGGGMGEEKRQEKELIGFQSFSVRNAIWQTDKFWEIVLRKSKTRRGKVKKENKIKYEVKIKKKNCKGKIGLKKRKRRGNRIEKN